VIEILSAAKASGTIDLRTAAEELRNHPVMLS
jgi:hypothetical protein